MKIKLTVLLVCGAACMIVAGHELYALHHGIHSVTCQWLPDTSVTIAPGRPGRYVTTATSGKDVLRLIHRRAREGWFIVATDSSVSDHFTVELDSMREGQTYAAPSECRGFHYRFTPFRGPTVAAPGDTPTGSITIVRILHDRVRARFELAVEPYDFMGSRSCVDLQKDFVRYTGKHGVYVAFGEDGNSEPEH